MSLIPIRRSFDPLNTWDVTPFDYDMGRRSLYDPYTVGAWDPALVRSQQTINTFSPILAADLIESANDFHVHVSVF